jgi:hypothetical protein
VATVAVPRTWTAGEIATGAFMNGIRDALNFLLAPPAAVVRQTVVQSIPTSVQTPLLFDTEDADSDGGHSASSNTDRYTAQTPGWYNLRGQLSISANTGRFYLQPTLNGTNVNGCFTNLPVPGSGTATLQITGRVFLNVGDILRIEGFQTSGAASNTVVTGGAQPSFHVEWASK